MKQVTYSVIVNGKEHRCTMTLEKSGAFKYGNGTYVRLTDDEGLTETFDTRYEVGITQNFESWCDEFIKRYCAKDAIIERL